MTAQTLELETTTVTVNTMKMQESYAFQVYFLFSTYFMFLTSEHSPLLNSMVSIQMQRLYVISSRLCHWKTLQNVVRKTLNLDHQKHAYTGNSNKMSMEGCY